MDFHVAGPLEFLVDHFVHLRSGVDQGGGDDGQAAAFLDIAGGAEETLRPLQGIRVHAPGQHFAGRGRDRVVGAGQARDRIQQDHDVAPMLHQAACFLDRHVGHLDVPARGFIEGARDYVALDHPFHLGDFLRALVDQQHDQVALR